MNENNVTMLLLIKIRFKKRVYSYWVNMKVYCIVSQKISEYMYVWWIYRQCTDFKQIQFVQVFFFF